MKKVLSALLVSVMVFSAMSMNVYAKEVEIQDIENTVITQDDIDRFGVKMEDEFGNEVIEIPIDIDFEEEIITPNVENSEDDICIESHSKARHISLTPHTHSITNKKKILFNDVRVMTQFSTAPKISFSLSRGFTLSASINTSVGVSADVVSGNIGGSITGSVTVTATETHNFDVPPGYKGRVVYRYSYDYYTFNCVTKYNNGKTETGSGNATSKPYGGYFTLQMIQA